jgi:polyhydroxybutyrate depolymerase
VRRVPYAVRLKGLSSILLACLLAGLSTTPGNAGAGGGPCAHAPRRGNLYVQATVGGVPRSAIVHVPRVARSRQRLPLVLAFHGSGGTGAFMAGYSGLEALSDRAGFISVFPSAARPHRRWVLANKDAGGPQDLAFVTQVLDSAEAMACVDTSRVYAAGVSNGGGMAARLGCELNGRLAAIASVAGGYSLLDACHPARPVSVLEIHGTADRVVPYAGRPDGRGSVMGFLSGWTAMDGCHGTPRRSGYAPSTVMLRWSGCRDGTVVEHLRIYGGGHAWPGATPPDRAPTARFSAANALWSFFRGQSRPPA